MKNGANAANAAGWRGSVVSTRDYVCLIVGYGCYLAYYPVGSLGAVYLSHVAAEWQAILFARMLFFLTTIMVIFALKVGKVDGLLGRRALNRGSLVAAALCFPMLYGLAQLGLGTWALCLFALVLGAATASSKLSWYEAFLEVYRTDGRTACVVSIAGCFLFAVVPMVALPLLNTGWIPATLMLSGLVLVSLACQEATARSETLAQNPDTLRSFDYRATPYTLALVICFGITWSFTYTYAVSLGYGAAGSETSTGVLLAGLVVSSALIAIFAKTGVIGRMRFGMILRVIVVYVGSMWALMPEIAQVSPSLACFLCSAAYIVQGAVMILFIAEICKAYHLTLVTVTAKHYGTFILAVCAGNVLFWAMATFLDMSDAISLTSAIAVIASLATIIVLPGRESKAGVFAVRAAGDAERARQFERAKEAVGARGGLTPRESQILEHVIDGKSREEIATELQVSAYTVKNHIASIYAKLGVHTRADLAKLVEEATAPLLDTPSSKA